jgi:hypothetical protein
MNEGGSQFGGDSEQEDKQRSLYYLSQSSNQGSYSRAPGLAPQNQNLQDQISYLSN